MIDRKIGDKPINFEVTIGKIYGRLVISLSNYRYEFGRHFFPK